VFFGLSGGHAKEGDADFRAVLYDFRRWRSTETLILQMILLALFLK